ncbi:hypothetical protein GCM10023190_05820 [Enteractinococcus fodinae]
MGHPLESFTIQTTPPAVALSDRESETHYSSPWTSSDDLEAAISAYITTRIKISLGDYGVQAYRMLTLIEPELP